MSGWTDWLWTYLALLGIAVLAHEPWRWAGYAVGRNLDPQGEVFKWVKLVSTALVSALVARLVLFPAGALVSVPLWVRLVAFFSGIVAFYLAGRTVWIGVCAAGAIIAVGKLAVG